MTVPSNPVQMVDVLMDCKAPPATVLGLDTRESSVKQVSETEHDQVFSRNIFCSFVQKSLICQYNQSDL